MIHRVSPDFTVLEIFLDEIVSQVSLPEFYLQNGELPFGLITLVSSYDYKKSKIYRGSTDHAALMDEHIPKALCRVLQTVTPDHRLFDVIKMQSSTVNRDAFVGALCSYRAKRKIEVRYRSFSRSHELRFFITDVVKYSENKLRSILGL